ncbi:MAG: site-2 protease family protein [Planctomycetota bacterium]
MILTDPLTLVPLHLGLFIETIGTDLPFFLTVVVTVVFSITLHELAHGYAAIRLGDDTPIRTGHMTLNPIVHMGPFSLIALAIAGIAWGSMPIDPSRIRHKYGEAIVAAAGPATNLLLAAVGVVGYGLLIRFGLTSSNIGDNAADFLWTFGFINAALMVFNLLPVPPLDGSHILANFNDGYARFISNPSNQGLVFILFPIAFLLSSRFFAVIGDILNPIARFIAGTG